MRSACCDEGRSEGPYFQAHGSRMRAEEITTACYQTHRDCSFHECYPHSDSMPVAVMNERYCLRYAASTALCVHGAANPRPAQYGPCIPAAWLSYSSCGFAACPSILLISILTYIAGRPGGRKWRRARLALICLCAACAC